VPVGLLSLIAIYAYQYLVICITDNFIYISVVTDRYMSNSKNNQELFEILRVKLNLSDGAAIKEQSILDGILNNIRIDLLIEDEDREIFVEVKSKASVDAIARLVLLKELFRNSSRDMSKTFFVVASKVFSSDVEMIADQTGIKLVTIPRDIAHPAQKYEYQQDNIKVSSEKSWRIISRLLKDKMTSIRQLSIIEKVSYGWAHATIKSLLNQKIAIKNVNYVSITDTNKLLNGVAWERPFENLFLGEINIEYDDAFEAAQELSQILKNKEVKFSFTSYTAAGLYTGYAIRHDIVYIYLEKNDVDFFKEVFGVSDGQGIKARIYVPDRDVFSDVREKEGIQIASPSQTLLDLAGLGYGGRDITKAMVEKYATL